MDFIGIDYGSKYIGLSWGSDELGVAVPLQSLCNFSSIENVVEHLNRLVLEKGCDAFVLGLPLHMDGTEGTRVQEVRRFADQLKTYIPKPIFFQDERLSTQATQYLSGYQAKSLQKAKKQKARGIVDSQSAMIILQDFLERTQEIRDTTLKDFL